VHAHKLIQYLTTRGGKVDFQAIPAPELEWKSALNILETTLKMEKDVTQALLKLSRTASQSEDPELEDFINSEFLHEQTEDIKKAADMITQLQLAGPDGLGLYLFDKQQGK
jgi:ferritin heavy chain